ncbi:carboxymuconolactone decarboxylase family protein [Kitasatospora sp. NPDC059673]|uniref:carboxymuconolactone decarboxylase family protein n=1 Tax=Kitasatospora sp. NPDC059673 TaxID=3346901 RepID=UPI0036CA4136
MPRLPALTPDTAVGASRDLLAELVSRHGSVGDMVSTMAHSPAVLGGYLQLSRAMGRAKLDRRISERISVAVQVQQGCGRCLDAHVGAARALGVDEEEIERARKGTSADPAIAAIIALALQVHREPASITDEQVTALRAHGYSDRAIADVVGVVALNVLTGAFNLLAGLTPGSERDTGA